MTKATYWQRGETIDYPNGTTEAIEAGTVLELEGIVGIAGELIAPGETGTAHIEGVYRFPKASGETFAIGAEAYLVNDEASATDGTDSGDGETQTAAETGGGIRLGRAVAAAAADDTEVLVKINV